MNKSLKKVSLTQFKNIPSGKDQFSINYIKHSQSIILEIKENCIIVGYIEPPSAETFMYVTNLYRNNLEVVLIDKVELYTHLSDNFAEPMSANDNTDDPQLNQSNNFLDTLESDAPVVNLVNTILMAAIQNEVTDIHIECVENCMLVKHRVDGILVQNHVYSREYFKNIASRLKIMSNLDIMEKRYPQDGRITVTIQNVTHDIRVSFLPSYDEESIVLRVLQEQKQEITIEQLGFSTKNNHKILKTLEFQQGLVLVSGPTGSGKTTTLHTILNMLNTGKEKIITIEDPIEYIVKGITQIQVNERIGLGFDTLLRRVLRHDPDIIMVGEIRDTITAKIVAQSALTGHFVFSTIHTNDAMSTIVRLKDLGIDNFLIAAVLRGVISQRLVRKICDTCKAKKNVADCTHCLGTGYKGRILLEEFLPIDENIKELILKNDSQEKILQYMKSKKIKTLVEDAKLKISLGLSDEEEVKKQVLIK